jgi:hypothetical protein
MVRDFAARMKYRNLGGSAQQIYTAPSNLSPTWLPSTRRTACAGQPRRASDGHDAAAKDETVPTPLTHAAASPAEDSVTEPGRVCGHARGNSGPVRRSCHYASDGDQATTSDTDDGSPCSPQREESRGPVGRLLDYRIGDAVGPHVAHAVPPHGPYRAGPSGAQSWGRPMWLENSTDHRHQLWSSACCHRCNSPTSPPGSNTGSPNWSGPGQISARRITGPPSSTRVIGEYSPSRSTSPRATTVSSSAVTATDIRAGAAWTRTRSKPPAVRERANSSPFMPPSRERISQVQFTA